MKLFVWDLHGVLEKGNDGAVLEITNQALALHGHKRKMSVEESLHLSGLRWHEYFAFLLPDVDPQEHLKLQTTCFAISENQPEIVCRHMSLNDHADQVLEAIHHSEHLQILISNTLPKSLDLFINILGIEKYFPLSQRFGVDTHHQKKLTKKDYLAQFIKDKSFPRGIISIGDSPSDMALVEPHVHGIGYLYTHPNREHRTAQCHHKIHDLRLVLQEI